VRVLHALPSPPLGRGRRIQNIMINENNYNIKKKKKTGVCVRACACASVDLEYYYSGLDVTNRRREKKNRRSLRGFGGGNSIRIYTAGQRVETNNNIVLRTIVAAGAERGLATSQKSRRSRPLSDGRRRHYI